MSPEESGQICILSFTSKAIRLEKRPMRNSTCPARRSTWSKGESEAENGDESEE